MNHNIKPKTKKLYKAIIVSITAKNTFYFDNALWAEKGSPRQKRGLKTSQPYHDYNVSIDVKRAWSCETFQIPLFVFSGENIFILPKGDKFTGSFINDSSGRVGRLGLSITA